MSRLTGPPKPTGTTVKPDPLRPSSKPVRAIEGPAPPKIGKYPTWTFETIERLSRRYGLDPAFAEHFHGLTEGNSYNPSNVHSYKRAYEHAGDDLVVEKKRNVDPLWDKLTESQKRNVRYSLDENEPSSTLATTEERLYVDKTREYWQYTENVTGSELTHEPGAIPRGQGPWDVVLDPTSPRFPGLRETAPFGVERDAIDYMELMQKTYPTAKFKLEGPTNLDDLTVPGTDPIPPRLTFNGSLPDHISPQDGILQAGQRLLRYRYEQNIKEPVNAFRRHAQMNAAVEPLPALKYAPGVRNEPRGFTPEEFEAFDNAVRRDVYGQRGATKLRQSVEPLNAMVRQGLNTALRAMGAPSDMVFNPLGGIADTLLTVQHFMQLTTVSENFNRKAEYLVQVLPETNDFMAALRVENALLSRDGRRWLTGVQDSLGASPRLADPRVEDPSRSGSSSTIAKIQGAVLYGHRLGTNEGVLTGAGNAYELYAKHGFTPDLLVTNQSSLLRKAFPELTDREAWNRVVSNVERIEQNAWDAYKADPANVSFSDMKREKTIEYLTETLGENSFIYPEGGSFSGRPLDMNSLAAEQWVPLGGHLMNGTNMFLYKNMYLRGPGYALNIETYAPNLTRYGMPYINPSLRHSMHVYDMHMRVLSGREYTVDPGLREALVQQTMGLEIARRALPAGTWWLTRTMAAGGRLPLNVYNLGAHALGEEEVDLQDLVNEYGPDKAYLIYYGLLSQLGVNFSGLDVGTILGERRSDLFGSTPDETHDTLVRILAEYIYNMTIGRAMPITLYESWYRTRQSDEPISAMASQFGAVGSAMRAYKGAKGMIRTNTRGMNPLEQSFRPPPQKFAGTQMPEESFEGKVPLSQLFRDLTPAARAFYMQIADEALQRVEAMGDPEASILAKQQHEATIDILGTEPKVQASGLEWLLPKSEIKEITGQQPLVAFGFAQRQRDIYDIEPLPLDSEATGWFEAALRSRSKFERQVVSEMENAAKQYLKGEAPTINGYDAFMPAREPGTIVVNMDRQTALDIAAALVTEYATGKISKKERNRMLAKATDEYNAAVYGPQHRIVQEYATLIQMSYNNAVNNHKNQQRFLKD